jgi:hypothetical protein
MNLLLLMEIECLRRIDAQLGAYIRVTSSANDFSDNPMDSLYTRLVSLPETTDVQSADDINKICLAFFDYDDAYTVDEGNRWCIDIKRKVVSGEHKRCTKCSISFPRQPSKFADKFGRITEISFGEAGSWHKEVYNSKLELIKKLCISFLPEQNKFADKSERITGISFFEEGLWHKEVYNSKLELITKLCISFLPDSDEKNIIMKKLEDHFR